MTLIVELYLGLALLAYVVFAGADFGAGVLELTAKPSERERLSHFSYLAMGPVWEANHVWLILVVVILFVGYPTAFSEIAVVLHLPLTILLFGIIIRGCAFTFRHYDAFRDGSQRVYSLLFRASSLLTPVFLGICAGALLSGRIPKEHHDFPATFVAPWLGFFPLSIGLFLCVLCTMLAANYLIGESNREEDRRYFAHRAKQWLLASIVTGGFVFVVAFLEGVPLLSLFLSSPVSLAALATATVVAVWHLGSLERIHHIWRYRLLAGVEVSCILIGWFAAAYPAIIRYADGDILSVHQAIAPPPAIFTLGIALIVGSALILPALAALIGLFKRTEGGFH